MNHFKTMDFIQHCNCCFCQPSSILFILFVYEVILFFFAYPLFYPPFLLFLPYPFCLHNTTWNFRDLFCMPICCLYLRISLFPLNLIFDIGYLASLTCKKSQIASSCWILNCQLYFLNPPISYKRKFAFSSWFLCSLSEGVLCFSSFFEDVEDHF